MELEFDKEIDAILRKARRGMSVSDVTADHLDADALSAFAENALPDGVKQFYVVHLADCERCRKQLSFTMRMNTESEAAVLSPFNEPVASTVIPWYRGVFKTPNLALVMGALVLAFGGVLGYLSLLQRNSQDRATVSQITEPEQGSSTYSREQNLATNTAPLNEFIATTNPTAPAYNSAANTTGIMSGPSFGASGRADTGEAKPDVARENNFQLDGVQGAPLPAEPPAKSVAAPPSVTTDVTASTLGADRDEKKPNDDGKLKEESKDLELAKRARAEDRGYRDTPRAAAKSGPSRAGPVQGQLNQMNSNMTVTRVVGGKTFNSRNGAWYDSAYHNQTTFNFRRGTDEYKKLDGGLRNIVDTLGGTVVIVWKSKAYRIQ